MSDTAEPTFAEFNAMRRRNKASEDVKQVSADPKPPVAAPAPASSTAQSTKARAADVDTVNVFLTEWFRLLGLFLVVHDIAVAMWILFVDARVKAVGSVPALMLATEMFELTSLVSFGVFAIEALARLALAYKHGLSIFRAMDTCLLVFLGYFCFWRGFAGELRRA